jgi:hypothetical protein
MLCFHGQHGQARNPTPDTPVSGKLGVISPEHRPEGLRVVPRPHPQLHVEIWTDNMRYRIGSDVRVYFRVERDARVYIFNTDASGHCSQIFPNAFDRDNWVRGGRIYSIPDPRYRLVATGPAGRESLTLVAYADETIYWREYHEFQSPAQPFPERPGGPKRLLEQLNRLGMESGTGESSSPPPAPTPPPTPDPAFRNRATPTSPPPETTFESRDSEFRRRGRKPTAPEPEIIERPVDGKAKDPARLRIEPLPPRPPRPPVGWPRYGEATTHFYVDYGHFRPGPPPWRWEGPPGWPPRPLPYPTPVPPIPTPPFDPYQPPWWRP